MKALVVLGTRPEVIKLAPVVRSLREAKADVVLVGTAQHSAMLDQALSDRGLGLDLTLMPRSAKTLGRLTADLLPGLEALIESEKPDVVIVQGDTTSALCGALAGFYLGIPVAHVEAGLRTSNPREPFPEEMNRRAIAHMASFHFAPTERAYQALYREGARGVIEKTGNTIVDELRHILRAPWSEAAYTLLKPIPKPYVLVTCHRREALDSRLALLVEQMIQFSWVNRGVSIIWPAHANPMIMHEIERRLKPGNFRVMSHLPYSQFIALVYHAGLIVTDSGGVIEEATTLGRRLVIIRDETERPEALESSRALLVKREQMPDLAAIAVEMMITKPQSDWCEVFGDGRAAERIAATLVKQLSRVGGDVPA